MKRKYTLFFLPLFAIFLGVMDKCGQCNCYIQSLFKINGDELYLLSLKQDNYYYTKLSIYNSDNGGETWSETSIPFYKPVSSIDWIFDKERKLYFSVQEEKNIFLYSMVQGSPQKIFSDSVSIFSSIALTSVQNRLFFFYTKEDTLTNYPLIYLVTFSKNDTVKTIIDTGQVIYRSGVSLYPSTLLFLYEKDGNIFLATSSDTGNTWESTPFSISGNSIDIKGDSLGNLHCIKREFDTQKYFISYDRGRTFEEKEIPNQGYILDWEVDREGFPHFLFKENGKLIYGYFEEEWKWKMNYLHFVYTGGPYPDIALDREGTLNFTIMDKEDCLLLLYRAEEDPAIWVSSVITSLEGCNYVY